MYRCFTSRAAQARYFGVSVVMAAGACAATFPAHVDAQTQRTFPPDALRGRILVVQPPDIELNGHAQRLAPGSRIRNQNNLLEMSGALGNHTYIVNYTLDNLGQVRDVWILTDAERARRPWPTTPKQAAEWTFDVQTQTWSRP